MTFKEWRQRRTMNIMEGNRDKVIVSSLAGHSLTVTPSSQRATESLFKTKMKGNETK
jgi:hypothetical protein